MTRLLISANSTSSKGLYVLDTDSKHIQGIYNKMFPMGICRSLDGFFVADRFNGVYRLNRKLEIVQYYNDVGLDLHDMLVLDDEFWVVVSSENKIKAFLIETGEQTREMCISHPDEDIHHLNSLKYHNGKFYLSMFNLEPIKQMRLLNNGVIVRVDPDTLEIEETVVDKLCQPHSITFVDDDMYFCDSRRARLCKYPNEIVTHTLLYNRGLAYRDGVFYIGENTARHFTPMWQHQTQKTQANILVYDVDTKTKSCIPLPIYELYDIVILEDGEADGIL